MNQTDNQLLNDVYRSSHAWAKLGGRTAYLPIGEAVTNPAYTDHHEGNCLWEVRLNGMPPRDAMAIVDKYYAEQGHTCFGWTPALDELNEPLASELEASGYERADSLGMALEGDPARQFRIPHSAFQMLSARDYPDKFLQVFHLPGSHDASTMMAQIHLQRLAFAEYEAFAAVLDGQPVGRIGLHQVGDVGRIKSVFVGEDYRRMGIATAMSSYVVDMCHERGCRCACLEVDPDNSKAVGCYQRFGFRTVGVIRSFARI